MDELDEIYDEDYDESYDDEILEETEDEVNNKYQNEFTLSSDLKDPEPIKNQESLYIKVIKKYLEKETERNPYFAEKYKPDLVPKCFEYIKEKIKAMSKGNVAMIQSGKVFAMAISYFDDEIYNKLEKEKAEKEKARLEKIEQEKIKKEKEEQLKKEREEFMKTPMKSSSYTQEELNKWRHAQQLELF